MCWNDDIVYLVSIKEQNTKSSHNDFIWKDGGASRNKLPRASQANVAFIAKSQITR